jgi:hypothetical protein
LTQPKSQEQATEYPKKSHRITSHQDAAKWEFFTLNTTLLAASFFSVETKQGSPVIVTKKMIHYGNNIFKSN